MSCVPLKVIVAAMSIPPDKMPSRPPLLMTVLLAVPPSRSSPVPTPPRPTLLTIVETTMPPEATDNAPLLDNVAPLSRPPDATLRVPPLTTALKPVAPELMKRNPQAHRRADDKLPSARLLVAGRQRTLA